MIQTTRKLWIVSIINNRILKKNQPIIRLLADILFMFAFILLIPTILAYVLKERAMWITFGIEAILCFLVSFSIRLKTNTAGMKQYHGAIAIALAWTIISLIATIPFRVAGVTWIDALFEAFSGWTDTGASMIPNPETLPYSLGLFRAMSQWLSGLGLVVLLLS